jgi:hypothetical protein
MDLELMAAFISAFLTKAGLPKCPSDSCHDLIHHAGVWLNGFCEPTVVWTHCFDNVIAQLSKHATACNTNRTYAASISHECM